MSDSPKQADKGDWVFSLLIFVIAIGLMFFLFWAKGHK